jgi:hypothetical protein
MSARKRIRRANRNIEVFTPTEPTAAEIAQDEELTRIAEELKRRLELYGTV